MAAKVRISLTLPGAPASATLVSRQPPASAPREAVQWLIRLFSGLVAGLSFMGRMRVSIDGTTGVKAALTLTAVDYDDGTVGDRLVIKIPGQNVLYLTAVTGTAGVNQYSIDTSDNACATSIAAAINASPQCRGQLTAVASNATVICTAFKPGTMGNSISIDKIVTTSTFIASTGSLSGGVDEGAPAASVLLTIAAALTANDTLTIGTVVLTAKASPSGENQFAGAVSQDADTAALVACINAHSKLKGLFSAVYGGTGTGKCTISTTIEGRELYQTVMAISMAQGTLAATTFACPTTDVWAGNVVDYNLGAP